MNKNILYIIGGLVAGIVVLNYIKTREERSKSYSKLKKSFSNGLDSDRINLSNDANMVFSDLEKSFKETIPTL